MERSQVHELHYITSVDNLSSIVANGLLSHDRASALPHNSVALESVQNLRANKWVPGQRRLHEYANLYFDARNPMMYLLRVIEQRSDLLVLRVSHQVLDVPGAVVTDGNAASGTTRFLESPTQLAYVDRERTLALSWNHHDPFVKAEWKRQRCAEILVPDGVMPALLLGGYVELPAHAEYCQSICPTLPMEVNPHVFFQ